MSMNYAIITPAFNEEAFIERTIASVTNQSLKPTTWLIVDDGSTDNTAEIVKKYAAKYSFIKYYRREKEVGTSYYSSNVYAIMEGWKAISDIEIEYLAILDSDIQLPEDYYQQITNKMDSNKELGIGSGIYQNLIEGKLVDVLNDRRSTPKALQVFRKECWNEIGGYLPLKYGGEDTCSCITARMKGWQVWSFPEIKAVHLRPTGTGASSSAIKAKFKQGLNEYALGTHPLFILLKVIRRCIMEKPLILGGLARFAGFISGYFRKDKRQVPKDIIKFARQEQLRRVFKLNRVS